jgi:SulP family sulfate permease
VKSPISLPKRKDAKNDLVAGLTTGLVQIPDAMATAILALVKPVNGLNTLVIGTPIGALFAGSIFMTVTTTGAIALAVADAVGKAGADERTGLLIMLTLMVGVIQLAFGLLKLGWITKGQLGDLTGYSSEYSNKVVKTVDLVLHFNEISWPTLAVGLATVALILLFGRTPASKFAMVLAFAAVTIGVALLGLGVQLVGDIAAIPSGLPQFQVPDLAKAPGLIVPAIAIAAIGLIQGAG